MNTTNPRLETCRQLIAELRWTERHAEHSARIAVSKALWLGLERDDLLRLICAVPSATYLRQCPHILAQAWQLIESNQPSQCASEFEQLLNGLN